MTAPKNNKEENKPDLSLLPLDLLAGLARAYEYGCFKYYRNSWREGFQTSSVIRAALSHISKFWDEGKDLDAEALEAGFEVHHIDMAIFNLLCVKDAILNHPELVDRYERPKYLQEISGIEPMIKETLIDESYGVNVKEDVIETTPKY